MCVCSVVYVVCVCVCGGKRGEGGIGGGGYMKGGIGRRGVGRMGGGGIAAFWGQSPCGGPLLVSARPCK